VKRRAAIKQIGFGLSASLALPSFLAACDDKSTGPEVPFDGVVGIIGAGAAGLFAADILRSKGINVRIFEAHDRVGGRIYSIRSFDPDFETFPKPDFPLELGAERILGTDGFWAKEIKLLNVPTVTLEAPVAIHRFMIDGALKTETDLAADADFVAAQNFLANLSTLSGTSVQSAIQAAGISPRMHAILNSLIGNHFGTDNPTLGATGLAEALTVRERNNEELVLLNNPMQDVLISRFANTVSTVELNRQVSKIDYSAETISLTVRNLTDPLNVVEENVVVNKLIIAVPLSILKDGDIEFTPSLPDSKSSAMSRIGFGASMRVVLDFRQNLWGTDTSFILGGTQGPLYFNTGAGRSEFYKNLTVTINGPKAAELSLEGENAVNKLIQELDIVLESNASANLKSPFIIKDWTVDPFIKGGYSYPMIGGGEADRTALAEPIDGTIFFAGEATDVKGDWGTVNGALNSAERAALEVINSILNPDGV